MTRSRAYLFHRFLWPALLGLFLCAALATGSFMHLRADYNRFAEAQQTALANLGRATRLADDMVQAHAAALAGLQQAAAGKLSEEEAFRLYRRLADGFVPMATEMSLLTEEIVHDALSTTQANELADVFADYRNLILMASEIASINPKTARRYVDDAHMRYAALSSRLGEISEHQTAAVRRDTAHAHRMFLDAAFKAVLTGLLFLVCIAGIVYAAARLASRRLEIIAAAMDTLAAESQSPPPLPALDALPTTAGDPLDRLTSAVRRFREALLQLSFLRAEEQLSRAALSEARHAAEAASQAKTLFLANMSHELRTPMNGVMGMIALARRRAVDPQQIDHLDKAATAARNMLVIVDDILDISRIEAERLTLDDSPFLLAEVVEGLRDVLAPRLREKVLALQIDLPPPLATRPLRGDPVRLGQVLINLAGNAIKFSEPGSTVHVRIRREIADEASITLHFEVEDRGPGIAPVDQARIFAAFEQADASAGRRHGGAGLGLAISKRLVGLMGGQIGVRSELGLGSTFWFSARFGLENEVPVASGEALPLEAGAFAGTRVLLAEDEPINREISLDLLASLGCTVDCAEDGTEAVALAEQNAYDLILMDVQMPKLDGLGATRAIRQLPGHGRTPIVALTANAFPEDRAACLAAGMSGHLGKPIEPEMLYKSLSAWTKHGDRT